MAKGKNAIALFEVIQSNKTARRSVAEVLRTPKWWFKSRGRGGATAAHSAASAQAAQAAAQDAPSATTTATAGGDSHHTCMDPASSAAPAPRAPGIDLRLDPDRQRITFHVSYTSAVVTVFAIVVVVTLAYLIGRRFSSGPASALAGPSSEQLRQGPARPQVLDVAGTGSAAAMSASPTASPVPSRPAAETEEAITAAPRSTAPPAPNEAATGQRIIGRNYVVVQIYLDEKSATEARDVLASSGIAATIEKGLPEYASSNWYCVVGLRGFDRIRNNPEYDRYEQAIIDAGAKFVKNPKFKKFNPQPYRWRG